MDIQMKLDGTTLKQLREAKSWSQEHLAEAASLSLRTIQRMEAEGSASPDSKLAVAAALGVPVDVLTPTLSRSAPPSALEAAPCRQGGTAFGYAGVGVGTAAAAVGIVSGTKSPGEAGLLLGVVGAFAGLCCAFIGVLARSQRKHSNNAA